MRNSQSPSALSERWNPDFPRDTNPLRPSYPSDLSNAQWTSLSPLLERHSNVGRPRRHTLRNIVDAINYRWQTGCVWRMLPHDFPPWETVYSQFRDWQRRGLLRQIREQVLRPERTKPVARPQQYPLDPIHES